MRENGVQSSEKEKMSSQFEPQRELTVFNGAHLENELDSHLFFCNNKLHIIDSFIVYSMHFLNAK